MEQLTQSATEGVGVKGACGSEFRGGLQNTRDDHGQDEIAIAVGLFIEEDPDAATVQFVVKAFPVNSSAAQLHMLLTLQSQIQEKEKAVLSLERTLVDLRGVLQETVSGLKDQIQTLQGRIETSQQQADSALRERDAIIRDLQASNEELSGWLTKYKNAKEKLLPSGSLRDRVARKLAGGLLSKSAPAPKPSPEPEPSDRR